MSDKDYAIHLLDKLPAYKLGYAIAYIQGLTADEDADDAFCESILQDYLENTTDEERETISLEEAAALIGENLDV